MGHSFNKENSDKLVLVHLLVEIINYTKMHGEYKVKFVTITTLIFFPWETKLQVQEMNNKRLKATDVYCKSQESLQGLSYRSEWRIISDHETVMNDRITAFKFEGRHKKNKTEHLLVPYAMCRRVTIMRAGRKEWTLEVSGAISVLKED